MVRLPRCFVFVTESVFFPVGTALGAPGIVYFVLCFDRCGVGRYGEAREYSTSNSPAKCLYPHPRSLKRFPSLLPTTDATTPEHNTHSTTPHNTTPPFQVMGESSVSPYGVAAGACISHPSPHIAERWQRATTTPSTAENGAPTKASSATATAPPQEPLPLGGRVYRLTKFAEKPTAEFAREKLVTPGLGRGDGGEGKHLVVFGQASRESSVSAVDEAFVELLLLLLLSSALDSFVLWMCVSYPKVWGLLSYTPPLSPFSSFLSSVSLLLSPFILFPVHLACPSDLRCLGGGYQARPKGKVGGWASNGKSIASALITCRGGMGERVRGLDL